MIWRHHACRTRVPATAGAGKRCQELIGAWLAAYAGYNPTMAGKLRQGRIPRRYIVRMKRGGKDLQSTIAK